MCAIIVPDSPITCNPRSDRICPRCYNICAFACDTHRVARTECGWAVALTDTQHAEIVEALAGVTTLPLPAYLQVLAATAPASPSGDTFGGWRTSLALGA